MEPVARHGARASAPRRICSPGTSTRPARCSRRRPRWPSRCRNTDSLVDSEAELAVLAMDRGRWAEAAEHVERALAAIDEHRMHDYATSVLAFAAAARLAVHRGDLKEADRQLTRAMRARPSCTFVLPFLAVRARLQLAKVYWRHRRPRDRPSPAARDRRHPAPPAGPRRARRRGRGVSPDPHVERAGGSERRVAPHPGRAAAAPVPADAPHDPRDRRAAVRLPQHRQLRGQLDLPEARRLVPQRRGASRRRRSVCSAGSRPHSPDWCSKASSMSYPSAIASFGAAATTRGQPDDGNDADQHVDDLGGRRPGAHRGIGLRPVGRDRATDRDQRGEADERQRLRIELLGLDVAGRRSLRRSARR